MKHPGFSLAQVSAAAAVVLAGTAQGAMADDTTNATQGEMLWWFGAMLVLGGGLFAVFLSRRQALFGALGALFLVGSSAEFWLTQPLWFPRLEISLRAPGTPAMLAILTMQGAVTLYALVKHLPRGGCMAALRSAGIGRILLLLLVAAGLSVPVTSYIAYGYPQAFVLQTIAGGALAALHLATLGAMLLVPGPRWEPRIPPVLAAGFAVLACVALGGLAFEWIPHVEDEAAYVFQARVFAGGALTAPAPPEAVHAALDYYLFDIRGDRWLAVPSPGWPAILALGMVAGLPWLVNPLLTGLSVLLAWAIARHIAGETRAGLVVLLMAGSPWVIATGASYMTHSAALFLLLLGWWCLLRAGDGSRRLRNLALALAGGLAIGWLFTTRPLEGLIMGVLTGLWLLRRLPTGLGQIAAYSLGCIAGGSAYLGFNLATTGSVLLTPQADYLARLWPGAGNTFGFGPDVGAPDGEWGALDIWPGHGPAEGLVNLHNLLASLNLEMLGWAFGSLVPLVICFLWGRGRSGFDRAMLLIVAVFMLVMFFYWYAGTFYIGPRYWYIAVLPFLYLSAAGLAELRDRLPAPARARFMPILLVVCGTALASFTSWRGIAKYHDYGTFNADIRDAARAQRLDGAIVLVATPGDFGVALAMNDPFLSPERPLFLRDMGPEGNAAIAAAFPDRPVIRIGPNR